VPDEGARGRQLELCVQAHFKAEEALLRSFRPMKGHIESALDPKTGLLRLKWVRGVWNFETGRWVPACIWAESCV